MYIQNNKLEKDEFYKRTEDLFLWIVISEIRRFVLQKKPELSRYSFRLHNNNLEKRIHEKSKKNPFL
jgi:hypothetical protein